MNDDGQEVEPSDIDLALDEVREQLYVALRAQERFTQNLRVLVEDLDKRKDGEEWLEQVQEEAAKGRGFYESQLLAWQAFTNKVDAYVDSVRKEADQLAIEELRIESKNGEENDASQGKARRAKTVHPELTKFKLEKQARILGKYGGVPAMGGGMVLGRLPRDIILKATASPAAVEIQYSKVEGKDAQYLAEVMRFKKRDSGAGGPEGDKASTPPPPGGWQAEVMERKGQQYFKEHETPAACSTAVHAPYAGELAEKLRTQQAALAAAEAAATATPPGRRAGDPSTPSIGSATSELAEKLKRQQATLKAAEDQAAAEARAAAAEAAEAASPLNAASTSWANAAVPFGNELSAALRERKAKQLQEQQQQEGQSNAAAAAAARTSSVSDASPGPSFRTASNAIAAAGSSRAGGGPVASAAAQGPVGGVGLPVGGGAGGLAALRRPPPPGAVGVALPGAGSNELEEALRRRQARQAAAAAAAVEGSGEAS